MRVAKLAFLNKGWCLPRKFSFASANGGILGFSRHRWSTQVLQAQETASLTPTPALRGSEPEPGTGGEHLTRRV